MPTTAARSSDTDPVVAGLLERARAIATLARERARAWRKYKMIVLTGIEFNKDGYTRKSSAHLLGIDLKAPIPSALDLTETIAQIHAQGGLAVASHPQRPPRQLHR